MSDSNDDNWGAESGSDEEYVPDVADSADEAVDLGETSDSPSAGSFPLSPTHSVVASRESSVVSIDPVLPTPKQTRSDVIGDAEDAVNAIEVEYFNDLSLHLYTTHLLRRRDHPGKKEFPQPAWYAWPQFKGAKGAPRPTKYKHNIPIPITDKRYISERDPTLSPLDGLMTSSILSQYIHNIRLPTLGTVRQLSNTTRDARVPGGVASRHIDPSLPLFEKDILDIDNGMKTAASLLMHELNAQYQRSIYTGIRAGSGTGDLQPIDEHIALPHQAAAILMNRINSILDVAMQDRKSSDSKWGRRLSWVDMIHENLLTGNTLRRCKSLFIDGNPKGLTAHEQDILNHSFSVAHGPGKRPRALHEEMSLKPIGISSDELFMNTVIGDVKYPPEFDHVKGEIRKVAKRLKKRQASARTNQ